jgi:uncharacterized protein YdeI (YjbR/CyaY-like superfamily)
VIERETVFCSDAAAWEAWLEAAHATSDGIRLAIAKKGRPVTSVSYADAVELALCFGWIDGQAKRLDDDHYLQLFTPRRARSIWSRINRDKATRLIDEGRMRPAGLAEVERAQADGRWDAAYASSATSDVPDDLAAALAASPVASEFFDTLTSQNRFSIIFRIGNVKRAETRARKIGEYIAMLERGETLYPQRATRP